MSLGQTPRTAQSWTNSVGYYRVGIGIVVILDFSNSERAERSLRFHKIELILEVQDTIVRGLYSE